MPDERAHLPVGIQHDFVNAAIDCAGGVDNLAQLLALSPRTIRDWRREKFLLPYATLSALSQRYSVPLPENIILEERFWYASKGARRGGLASYQKQGGMLGDPQVRQQKWRERFEREGRLAMPSSFHPLPFKRPARSVELAEFIGIMMGDGGMTQRQFTIALHHIDDLAYSKFVVVLIQKLFGIIPTVRHIERYSVNVILVSRSLLMNYLHELGLPFGNKVKQNFDVPAWIKENESYMTVCVRGLVDTDGSVFTHRYWVNGKIYRYKKISFCSASPPLRATVMKFLKKHDIYARVCQGKDLRIESKKGVARYMELIGSHNPKHLKRYGAMV